MKRNSPAPAPTRGRSLWPAALCLGAALMLPAFADSPDAVEEQLIELCREENELGPEKAEKRRARLVALGPEAVPAIFALFAGSGAPPEPPAEDEPEQDEPPEQAEDGDDARPIRTPLTEAMLLDALRAWPAGEVAAQIAGELGDEPPLLRLMVGVRLLGEIGSLETILALVETVEPIHLGRPSIRRRLTEALSTALERDPKNYVALRLGLDRLDGPLVPPVVQAVGSASDPDAIPLLEAMLARFPLQRLEILRVLGGLDPRGIALAGEQAAQLVRPYLYVPELKLRRQAVVSLGRLGDTESFAEIVSCLEDEDRLLRVSALGALHRLSGQPWSADAGRWMRWHDGQVTWAQRALPGLSEQIANPDAALALSAIRELAQNNLQRREVIETLAQGLRHSETSVALAAAQALGRIGDPAAIPYLIAALSDSPLRLRIAIGNELRRLAAFNAGREEADWLAWLEG